MGNKCPRCSSPELKQTERKHEVGGQEIQIMENKCAICGTGFFFSEDVQLYLAEAARVMNEKITQAARTSAAAIEAARTASPPGGDFDIQAPQEALKRADELDKKDGAPGGAQKAA